MMTIVRCRDELHREPLRHKPPEGKMRNKEQGKKRNKERGGISVSAKYIVYCQGFGHGIENNCRQNNSDPGQKDTENQNRAERLLQEEKHALYRVFN
jgi:hypothetical protein